MNLSPAAEALFRRIYASYDAEGRPINRGFNVSREDERAAAELRDAKLLTSGPFFGAFGHGKWSLTETGRQGPGQNAESQMKISENSREHFSDMHRQYVDNGRNATAAFKPKGAKGREIMHELRDAGLVEPANLGGDWRLTALGRRGPSALRLDVAAVHVGDNINISNANVGSVATRGGTATGTVSISSTIGQDEVRAAVGELQKTLIDKIDELDQRTYDFMSEILLKLRKLQIEAGARDNVLAQLQEKIDEDWAKEVVAEMRPSLAKLGATLGELANHPLAKPIAALIAASVGGS